MEMPVVAITAITDAITHALGVPRFPRRAEVTRSYGRLGIVIPRRHATSPASNNMSSNMSPADNRIVATFGNSVFDRNEVSDRTMSGVTMAATSHAASIPLSIQTRTSRPLAVAPAAGLLRRVLLPVRDRAVLIAIRHSSS